VGLKELGAGLRVKSQTLQQPHNKADPVGTGELEIWRGRELSINLNNLLQEYGNGANTIPEKYRQIIKSLSFPTQQIKGLLSFFWNSQILNVLNDGCKLLLVIGGGGFFGTGEGGVVLVVEVGRVAGHEAGSCGVHYI
jgi:hypothetical protein